MVVIILFFNHFSTLNYIKLYYVKIIVSFSILKLRKSLFKKANKEIKVNYIFFLVVISIRETLYF